VLWPFIEEHHGTTLVKYFLKVAADQQSVRAVGRHDREVLESEFRYPGPRPHTKETAILMLCDGAEGSVRSLPEPNPARIEGAVHRLVMERLNDGQFDRCEITMNELRIIEETLVKVLCSIYHGRVAYPRDERADKVARPEIETVAPETPAAPGRVDETATPGEPRIPTAAKQN
jgi:membrane-associated HD superfamily phosphohydrolase